MKISEIKDEAEKKQFIEIRNQLFENRVKLVYLKAEIGRVESNLRNSTANNLSSDEIENLSKKLDELK